MKITAVLLLIMGMLTGCTGTEKLLDKATELRTAILEAQQCTFQAVITADYGDEIFTFQMDCTADNAGALSFTVTDPESISGITGEISEDRGALTFNNEVLAFPILTDNDLSPVSTPWVFINTLRGGYLTGCSAKDDILCIYIDDSFDEQPLHVEVYADQDVTPVRAEVIWQDRRILTMDIRDFTLQ